MDAFAVKSGLSFAPDMTFVEISHPDRALGRKI
jgi:hypothetical protein